MKSHVVAYLRATMAGVVTASALPFLFAMTIFVSSIVTAQATQALTTLYVFLIVVVAIAAVVACVSLCVGLPISFLLMHLRRYTHKAHVVAGACVGFVFFPVIIALSGGSEAEPALIFLYIYSALAGGVTADSWWRNTASRHTGNITLA